MSLSAKERKSLVGASHRLKPLVTLSGGEVSAGALEQVRSCFVRRSLVKVRVQTDDRHDCEAVARTLVEGVPCELVRRIGHVLLLYRPETEAAELPSGMQAG